MAMEILSKREIFEKNGSFYFSAFNSIYVSIIWLAE